MLMLSRSFALPTTAAVCAFAALALASPLARAETPAAAHAKNRHAMRTAAALAKPARGVVPTGRSQPPPCTKAPVKVTTGVEAATFALAKCNGSPAPLAVEQLSVLARPPRAPKPHETLETLGKTTGTDLAPGVRRIDPRLVERLELVVDHFRTDGGPAHVLLVSGYRPRSAHSYHQLGRALDFRLDGVTNEALVAFCKTLPDTGCGYYPNSSFVHMDVRNPGTGRIAWVDTSGPGETPKYVSQWPLPSTAAAPRTGSVALPALPTFVDPREAEQAAGVRPRFRSQHPYVF